MTDDDDRLAIPADDPASERVRLRAEVERLEAEVERLEAEVERLEAELSHAVDAIVILGGKLRQTCDQARERLAEADHIIVRLARTVGALRKESAGRSRALREDLDLAPRTDLARQGGGRPR